MVNVFKLLSYNIEWLSFYFISPYIKDEKLKILYSSQPPQY